MTAKLSKYEKRLCILLFLSTMTNPLSTLSTLFSHYTPDHHCKIQYPQNEFSSSNISVVSNLKNKYLEVAIPDEEPNLFGRRGKSRCYEYNMTTEKQQSVLKKLRNGTVEYRRNRSMSENIVTCKHGSTFNFKDGETSAINEFQMFCNGNWKKTFALTLFMLGKMIGGLIGGTLSDKFGRKLVFLAFTAVQFSTSVVIGFATNFQVYAAMMLLCGCGGLVNYYAALTLGSEVVNKRRRNLMCACLSLGYAVGYMITPAFGYFLRNWRWYCRVTGFIGIIYIPYYWLLDESPVWLESKGKLSEAAKIRAKIDQYNGKNLTKNIWENLTLNPNLTPGEGIIKSWLLIFNNCRMVIRISIVCFGWCMSSITYFAIALDTNSLSGNRFLNCFYAGLVELVAYLISFGAVEVFGPKNIYIISMLAASGSVIVTPFIKLWSSMAVSVVTMAGKLFVGVGFYVACIMTTELFPTSIRNSVVAVAAASSKLGGVLAPLFIYSANEGDNWIPYVVVGLCIALSALLFLLLPKSRHQNLPRNVEEAANMKSSKLLSCCCTNHKSESLSEE